MDVSHVDKAHDDFLLRRRAQWGFARGQSDCFAAAAAPGRAGRGIWRAAHADSRHGNAGDFTELAVMWIVQAVVNVDKFWKLLQHADEYFRTERPDAVVLIDYPGFNWWIARKAKKHGIPVIYYGAPQMWAWGGWRIGKMRRLVDHVLCKLPFEAEWYRERGCDGHLRGAPVLRPADAAGCRTASSWHGTRMDAEQHTGRYSARFADAGSAHELAGISPGRRDRSRRKSRERDLPSPASTRSRPTWPVSNWPAARLPVEVFVNRTSEVIQLSGCCMACSGSVSLELMYYAKPSVIHYWINRRMYYFVKHFLLQCKYMTLVNLLACEDRFDLTQRRMIPASPVRNWCRFPSIRPAPTSRLSWRSTWCIGSARPPSTGAALISWWDSGHDSANRVRHAARPSYILGSCAGQRLACRALSGRPAQPAGVAARWNDQGCILAALERYRHEHSQSPRSHPGLSSTSDDHRRANLRARVVRRARPAAGCRTGAGTDADSRARVARKVRLRTP